MSFVTENQLKRRFEAPVQLPACEVTAQNGSIVVSQFWLAEGQELRISYLGLHFLKYSSVSGLNKLNTALPNCYLGLYCGNFQYVNEPCGRPLIYVGLSLPSFANLKQSDLPIRISSPGYYSFLLVNNSSWSRVLASVTGAVEVVDLT